MPRCRSRPIAALCAAPFALLEPGNARSPSILRKVPCRSDFPRPEAQRRSLPSVSRICSDLHPLQDGSGAARSPETVTSVTGQVIAAVNLAARRGLRRRADQFAFIFVPAADAATDPQHARTCTGGSRAPRSDLRLLVASLAVMLPAETTDSHGPGRSGPDRPGPVHQPDSMLPPGRQSSSLTPATPANLRGPTIVGPILPLASHCLRRGPTGRRRYPDRPRAHSVVFTFDWHAGDPRSRMRSGASACASPCRPTTRLARTRGQSQGTQPTIIGRVELALQTFIAGLCCERRSRPRPFADAGALGAQRRSPTGNSRARVGKGPGSPSLPRLTKSRLTRGDRLLLNIIQQ